MKRNPYIIGAGFMPDYACTAKCRHCLYGCSNRGSRAYVSAEEADRIMGQLEEAGIRSLHIGGGEPFLDFEGLCDVIRAMNRHHIAIDYIETNAFWCVNAAETEKKLDRLLELGADTIMASCDPFHIEYVPLKRVVTFVEVCEQTGIGYFVWKEQFFKRLSALDMNKTHTEAELKAVLGENYIREAASEYGIGMNGRALGIAREIYPLKKACEIASPAPCERLLAGHHCHIDLYGKVVPAGCTGFDISLRDFTEHRSELYDLEKHPVTGRLLSGGTEGLLKYAISKGFDENTLAVTSCDLCYRIRKYLLTEGEVPDVGPEVFYEMMES